MTRSVMQKLLRGGALILAIKVASGVIAFAMAAAMARALSVGEYGKFAAVLSAGLFLGQFATVGQPKLVQRFLGKYADPADAPKAAGLLADAIRRVGIAAVLTAVATVALTIILDAKALHWFALGPLVIGLAAAEYLSHVLRSLGHIPAALLPRDIAWRASVLALALGLIAIGATPDAAPVALGLGLWLCALIALQYRKTRQLTHTRYGTAQDVGDKAGWRHASWGLWGLNVLSVSFPHITVVAIGFLLGYGEAGSFFAALRIVGLLSMPLIAINLASGPDIARQFHENGPAAVQQICRSAVLILLPVVILAAVVVLALSTVLLGLFGEAALAARPALVILTIGYLINALSGSTGLLMQMTGHERRFLAYSALSNAVALLALFALVPLWGLTGAAICVVIASCGWNLAVVVWARRTLRIDPSVAVLVLGPPTTATAGN